MTLSPAYFFVLEGGEGAGKSTQAPLLLKALKAAGFKAEESREPGGTPLGEAIRETVKKSAYPLTSGQELLLFSAARVYYLFDIVKPALEAGTTLVSDRFSASTMAYQGYAGGVEIPLVEKAIAATLGDLAPHLTVVIDIPVEVGLARANREGGSRFEDKGADYHEKVRQGYLHMARTQPGYTLVDGAQPKQAVHAAILAALNERFGLALKPVI